MSGNSGNVDFASARRTGMTFAYLRVGRGKAGSATDAAGLDVRWPQYVSAARAAGLQVGGYWRFFPSVPLAGQLGQFAGLLKAGGAQLPPLVDIEDADGLSRAALTDWTISALAGVEQLTGVRPVLYTYRSFLTDQLDPNRLTGWPLALAAWTTGTDWPHPRAEFWQYAGDVVVPWSSGRVDLQRKRI